MYKNIKIKTLKESSQPKSYVTFDRQAKKTMMYCLKTHPERAKDIKAWYWEVVHGFTWEGGYRGLTDKEWAEDCLMYSDD